MAEKESDPCRVQLKDVRLSYPALWRPKGFGSKNEGEPAFQAAFLIDMDSKLGQKNIALVDDAIDAAKEKKWGDKQPKLKADKICFREGDPDDGEEQDGMMILSARNYKKPRIFDIDRLDVDEGDDGAPYAGCYVDAIIRIWAQDNEYGKRINCSLEAVRFRRDGEAFGAAPVDPDEFDDIEHEGRSSRRGRTIEHDPDEKPRGRRRSRDEDDDDEDDRSSRRSRRSRDDDDEDEKPSRRSRRSRDEDDDDEDEKPSRRSRRSRDEDDDDEDEKPSRRSRRSRDDDDDEDEKPSRRSRRSRDDDDDDDEGRSRRSKRNRDEDDDEDRPSRNSRSRRRNDDI